MTSFNAAAVLMPLDEYYEHFVMPKPDIPRPYNNSANKSNERQSAHLKSYKDNEQQDESQDEDVSEFQGALDNSNNSELDFESNDGNDVFESDKLAKNDAIMPANSVQWRIERFNLNRPAGAAPLVPIDAPRASFRQFDESVRNGHFNQKKPYARFNHNTNQNNISKNSVKARLGSKWGQSFLQHRKHNAANNDNVANINSARYSGYQRNLTNKNNSHNGPNNSNFSCDSNIWDPNIWDIKAIGSNNNDFDMRDDSNSMTSNNVNFSATNTNNCLMRDNSMSLTPLINTANQFAYVGNTNNNNNNNNTNSTTTSNNNNSNASVLNRLGPPVCNKLINSKAFIRNNEIAENSNNTTQTVFNENSNNLTNGSGSLRLADLLNINKDNCNNLNVYEIAKNAMFLLSSIMEKPLTNGNVQQEVSHIQGNYGKSEDPEGINMNMQPETTDIPISNRFQ